jgi:branched-chain amino acid transport system ATP-binding protein
MIEFKNVTAGYGEFMILNDLSFEAARAKITLLLGPNGAGKSTVLKTLFGLLKVKQGSVHLDGKRPADAARCGLRAAGP